MATVLIVDDEPDIRALLRRWLEKAGYQVIEAPDGEAGTRLCRQQLPDLIITDIIMPEQEGLGVIMALRKEFPDIKIIAISGGGVAMTMDSCLTLAGKLGASAVLSKPIRMPELLAAVADMVGQ